MNWLSKKKKKYSSFYHMPFEEAKPFLPRLYLKLSFIEELNIDILNFELKVLEGQTVRPVFVCNKKDLNNYLVLLGTEFEKKDIPPKNSIFLGYKHFDRFKTPDNQLMGDVHSDLYKEWINSNKLKARIQQQVLGWKYWAYKMTGKIK